MLLRYVILISLVLAAPGHAEDIPEYSELTGWQLYVGYVMAVGALVFACREAWKMWKERK